MTKNLNNLKELNYEKWKSLPTLERNEIRNRRARSYLSKPTPMNLLRALNAYTGGYDPSFVTELTAPSNLPTPVGGGLASLLTKLAEETKDLTPSFYKFVSKDPVAAEKAWSQLKEGNWLLRNWKEVPLYVEEWAKKQLRGLYSRRSYTDLADYGKGLIMYSSPNKALDYMDRSIKPKLMSDRQWGISSEDNWGTYIDRIVEGWKKGGKIHIKPENKGKFTSYCGGKVTLECIQRGKHSSSSAIRKRATFAENARHFKHENGGIIRHQEGGWFRKTIDNISNGFWNFGESTGLYDKQGFNHMISDLQDFGILTKGSEDGKSYGVVAPGILNGERVITVPKGMSGETLSDIILASSSNPAFNEAEKMALLDFQSQFGKGMPLATRRGRLAKKDAFGNNVRYADDVPVLSNRTLYLEEGVTGRLLKANRNRKAGIKTDRKQSLLEAYRARVKEDAENEMFHQGVGKKARRLSQTEKFFSTGDSRAILSGRPVGYDSELEIIKKNNPNYYIRYIEPLLVKTETLKDKTVIQKIKSQIWDLIDHYHKGFKKEGGKIVKALKGTSLRRASIEGSNIGGLLGKLSPSYVEDNNPYSFIDLGSNYPSIKKTLNEKAEEDAVFTKKYPGLASVKHAILTATEKWKHGETPILAAYNIGVQYLTPASPFFMIKDAIDGYRHIKNKNGTIGDYIAIFPFAMSGIKQIPLISNSVKNINRFNYLNPSSMLNLNIRTLLFNKKAPIGYNPFDINIYTPFIEGLYKTYLGLNIKLLSTPLWMKHKSIRANISGDPFPTHFSSIDMKYRQAAWAKYLGLNDGGIYKPYKNNSYTIDLTPEQIEAFRRNALRGYNRDNVLFSHGGINTTVSPTNIHIEDIWDLHPLLSFSKKYGNLFEASDLVPGAKPFKFELDIPR